ncbi:MAG: hypothetical protein A2275_17105 [Bacteroidetes bacterium RIFOXYA12_FULL_35_11]|nr:MAG: hypothetical protein A2X01_07365 [Bacteroidetes bacterium GWF2_35_48]OFY83407.1 MAG: hypothetical protein A2275_17105 [Bacteroidetes bacterium RIFOXYA12_FULL_35_11]HBX50662.1 hypothetical protein [Bacteroidales bacterium]
MFFSVTFFAIISPLTAHCYTHSVNCISVAKSCPITQKAKKHSTHLRRFVLFAPEKNNPNLA